jgi:hypothetical protein
MPDRNNEPANGLDGPFTSAVSDMSVTILSKKDG